MATYKVIQNIEAEDKLVGPFSLRQFIYAAIALLLAYIAFKFASLSIFLIIPFIPVVALFGTLAVPIGQDQPSEIWLLAKFRFILKPHKRIWNQDGAIQMVTVTAPKQSMKQLTNNMSRQEVTSRLQALANTIDSRGWAIKNVNVNLSTQNPYGETDFSGQRLISPSSLPQEVPSDDITAADDMMDQSNPIARHVSQLVSASGEAHRAKVVSSVTNPPKQTETTAHPDYWFMNNAPVSDITLPKDYEFARDAKVIAPGEDEEQYRSQAKSSEELALLEELHKKREQEEELFDQQHIRLETRPSEDDSEIEADSDQTPMKPKPNADIINQALAQRDNWSVLTQSNEARKKEEPPQIEIIIPRN